MTMLNAMVASSKTHATAMIHWLGLKPEEWEPIAYGDPIHKMFANARLVRPSEGVSQEHSDWVLEKLVPYLCLNCTTVPPNWRIPQEHVA
jgi:hypothetical protein